MENRIATLKNRIMRTRNARFEASRRANRYDAYSNFCIACLSLEIVAINLFQLIGKAGNLGDSFITATTIILSVFTLVLSLIVNQAKYSVKASNYNSCALDLDELAYDVERVKTEDDYYSIITRYVRILKQYNLNHTQHDDQWAMRKSVETKERFDYEANSIAYYTYRLHLWLMHNIFCISFVYLFLTVIGAVLVLILLCQ